jgi:hypothetical protein
MKLLALLLLFARSGFAAQGDFYPQNETELSSRDYLFREQPFRKDPAFDEFRTIDFGVNLGIGSDCGRVDFKSTLQGALKNILDSRYFGDMGKDIIAGSPMLLACYFSPTWCAILKHSQINANFMSQMRLNQCSLIDKYTDSRVDDFYEMRQRCIHREIEKNGGNMEAAMQSCNTGRVWDTDLTNWAGTKYGESAGTNKLIESSARWAGMDTPEGNGVVKLVQSLVGDTVVSRGHVSVDYGDRPIALTPRAHLSGIAREVREKLCGGLLKKIDGASRGDALRIVESADLTEITGEKGEALLDRQTIRNLAVMPYKARAIYCERLANSLSMARFSEDMNRSLDVLSLASQNPNLTLARRQEIEEKRVTLKQSVDATLELQAARNVPLNQVVSEINERGQAIHEELTEQRLERDQDEITHHSLESSLFDCADGVLCAKGAH